ncbi:MAG: hypothetical protein CVU39_23775 [Chloroflexi bacterium HGW-Chloroflexi-10]|nr:MAG: hypothetical protein CVU39_23775 [Chloroflexi bacterium HGW-Chloroflexi-10]
MAKKNNRNVSQSVSAVKTNSVVATTRTTSTDFNPDYSNIISDLKRIAILAVSFISILVVLSFFLR